MLDSSAEEEVLAWLPFAVARVVEFLNEKVGSLESGEAVLFSGRQGEFNKRGTILWQENHARVADALRKRGYNVEVIPVSNALRISRNK